MLYCLRFLVNVLLSLSVLRCWPHGNFTIIKGVVTNYGDGGATKREGGASEVLPLQKMGQTKF